MRELGTRIALWSVLATTAILMWIGASLVPLLDPDESRLARTAVEMMRSRDLVVPTYADRPRPETPPLLPWIQSSLFRGLGVDQAIARLPAVLATLASIGLAAWIARRRFGDEGALWCAVVLATMPVAVVLGPVGTLDALLGLHVLAAVALDIAEPRETGASRGVAVGSLLGLAFLIRGPAGVLLPLLVLLAGRTAAGRDVWPERRSIVRAVVSFAVVVLPWGLAFAGRLAGTVGFGSMAFDASSPTRMWDLVAATMLGFFPWIVPVGIALVRVGLRREEPASRTGAYAGAGLLVGLVFVGVARQDLPGAVLPLAPLAAIVATWELGRELDAPREHALGPLLLSGALGATALGLLLAIGTGLDPALTRFALLAAAVHGCAAAIGLGGALARRPRWAWGAAAAASAIVAALAIGLLLPRLAEARTAGYVVEAVPELRSRPVTVLERDIPSLTFYLDHVLPVVPAAHPILEPGDGLLVANEADLARIPASARSRLREIGRHGPWVVLENADERQIHPNSQPDAEGKPDSESTHNGRLTGGGPGG